MKNVYRFKIKRRLSPFQIIVLGFVLIVLVGSLLLMLPFASRAEGHASFIDAFFTATSAVCVTGLVVKDTATYWTFFGQLIILILIQIGGLGVVTVVVGFAMSLGRKIGLMQRNTMQAAISAPQIGGIMKLTNFIFKTTFCLEVLGAICLLPVFIPEFGPFRGIWYAVFHSISAFCNAGFDIMGSQAGEFVSMTGFNSNIIVNTVVMLLIIIGGIGFTTWNDFRVRKLRLKRFSLQSKVILKTTFLLLIIPAVFFYFFEFSLPQWQGMSIADKVLASLFQSVTTRTAGFNTVDLSLLSQASQIIFIVLMLVGGAPGSTAGGMKVTTFAVLFANTLGIFKRKADTTMHDRRISNETIKNAATIFMMYLVLFVLCGLAIYCIQTSIEPNSVSILECYFETASAIGTVGVTLGITTKLCLVSRLIIIFLMFFGRVGGLTLIFATTSHNITVARLPEEGISVG